MKSIKHILLLIILSSSLTISAQTLENKYICKKEEIEFWRILADSGKYEEAISVLFDSIRLNKLTNKKMSYWHIGQMYACDNNYNKAIVYLKKSTNIFGNIADREWRLYYKGTMAFLKKDYKKLQNCYNKLWRKHSHFYKNNACVLKGLYENFEKPYSEAHNIPCK